MSLACQRLGATILALGVFAIAAVVAVADALPDSTWVALKSVPHQGRTPLFALAVDPSNSQSVIAGTSDGTLLRSTNGGVTWSVAHSAKTAIITVAFDPYVNGVVIAGTHGSGALLSRDAGATWSTVGGLDGRTVRAVAFALTLIAAGTDQGLYLSQDGASWSQSSLRGMSITTIAVEAIHAPVRLVAASDSQASNGSIALYESIDGGTTWRTLRPPISGSFVVRLAAGPLPPTGNVRPLLVGTNTGLFESTDNGTTFTPLSGGGLLQSTDFTQIAFVTDHFDRFYAASDGGGSGTGGLWHTSDGGQTFTPLQPPEASVTALAVSQDETPVLYVATFRPSDHAAQLWTYHDTGGTPQAPPSTTTAAASGARTGGASSGSSLAQLLANPELPYIGLGLGAVAVILTAVAAHLHGRRR